MKNHILDYFQKEKMILTGKLKPTETDYKISLTIGIIYLIIVIPLFGICLKHSIFSYYNITNYNSIAIIGSFAGLILFPFFTLIWSNNPMINS